MPSTYYGSEKIRIGKGLLFLQEVVVYQFVFSVCVVRIRQQQTRQTTTRTREITLVERYETKNTLLSLLRKNAFGKIVPFVGEERHVRATLSAIRKCGKFFNRM